MKAPDDFEITADAKEAASFIRRYYRPMEYVGQTGLVLRKHGETAAAALYDGFTGANIWIQAAGLPGKPWLTRAALRWAFLYPFVQLGALRVSAWVESDNARSIRLCRHLGFVQEATLERAGRQGQAVFLFRMFREECLYV